MIVVLDTNVIVSALLSPTGPPAEIINRWEADAYQVATSPPLLTELERVLRYPRVRKVLDTILQPAAFLAALTWERRP